MTNVFRLIKYWILSFVMWIGWLPLILYKGDFFKVYPVYKGAYENKLDAIIYSFRISFYTIKEKMMTDLDFITGMFGVLFIYFVVLIILSWYRRNVYDDFMEDDSRKGRKDALEDKKDEDAKLKAIFGKTTPNDSKIIGM